MSAAMSVEVAQETRMRIYKRFVARERDFAAYEQRKTDHDSELWRRLGGIGLGAAEGLERDRVSYDIVFADEVVGNDGISRRAQELIDNFVPTSKKMLNGEAKNNARSALFEALVASGHMSVIELPGSIDEVHAQVVQRLLNSYHREWIAEHEKARNLAELHEELRIKAVMDKIVTGELPPNTKVITISDYADPLGGLANRHGYRSENKKGMIRETSLQWNGDSWTRVTKQISRSNALAGETKRQLASVGLGVNRSDVFDDLGLLDSQMLSVRYGAVEVMSLLDKLSGMSVRYGDEIHERSVEYRELEKRSKKREEVMAFHIERLAAYEKQLDTLLDSGKITPSEHLKRYVNEVRENVRAICVRFPEYTKEALGEAVIGDYEAAYKHYAAGDTAGAAAAVNGASGRESEVVVCGGSTASESTQSSQESPLESILSQASRREHQHRWVGCPFCGTDQAFYGDPCAKDMDCRECGAYTRNGRVMHKGDGGKAKAKTPAPSVSKPSTDETEVNPVRSAESAVEERFGANATIYFRKSIGGIETDIVNKLTREVIAKNVQL